MLTAVYDLTKPHYLTKAAVVNAGRGKENDNSVFHVGGDTKAGAAGAAAGELAAHTAVSIIANGKPTRELTQSEREQISQWGQIAGGIAGGLTGGGRNPAADIGAGAQAGKNAVENNVLALPPLTFSQTQQATTEWIECVQSDTCSLTDFSAKWANVAYEQEVGLIKGQAYAPGEYIKDIVVPVYDAATHPRDTKEKYWAYINDTGNTLAHPIDNNGKLGTLLFNTHPLVIIGKPMVEEVKHLGSYYFGDGGKEAAYKAGVESGKLQIDVGSLIAGIGEANAFRAGTRSSNHLFSIEGEAATKGSKVPTAALKSSNSITIIGAEPVKPLPAGGAPYLNAEQAKIAKDIEAGVSRKIESNTIASSSTGEYLNDFIPSPSPLELVQSQAGQPIKIAYIRMDHILNGEVKTYRNGLQVGTGGHYLRDPNVRVDRMTGTIDKNGVSTGYISIRDPETGKWVPKKAETSFFPEHWPKRQVANEIKSAFENSSPVKRANAVWQGTSENGLTIRGYYGKPDGSGATAWPIYNGRK